MRGSTLPAGAGKGVTAVERSANAKLGDVSATYVSQASCPADCPFRSAGCYAEVGHAGFTTRRLNRSGVRSPVLLAVLEARAVDGLTGRRHLRLHVVGDSTTWRGTRALAAAARRYTRRGGKRVWTYTHAWRSVRRADWGEVSVLASCETAADVRRAHRTGYAAALVVPEHPADGRAHPLAGAAGFKVVPCPQETRPGVTCETCGLCRDADRLHREKLVIGFAAHGPAERRVRFALQVLGR